MGKTRMCEPYGFIEGEAYYSLRNTIDDEIKTNREVDEQQTEEAFTRVEYNKEFESVIFKNSKGEAVGQLDMTEIIASALVKEAKYDSETQQLIIEFDNGDVIAIDLADLINIQEAGDGLKLDGNKFSIKIADDSEEFLQVTSDGLKNVGIQDAIDSERDRAMEAEAQEVADRTADVDEEEERAKAAELLLNQLLEAEINNRIADVNEEEARAISAETNLQTAIDTEAQNRIADVDEEETRAKAEEKRINDTIGTGFTTGSTETVTQKFIDLTNSLSDEINNRTTQDNQLQNNINNEKIAREGADTRLENLLTDERNRAISAETAIQNAINAEVQNRIADVDEEEERAISAETKLQNSIDDLDSKKFDNVEYDASAKSINFYANSGIVATLDATPFITDGMIDNVEIKEVGGVQVLAITFNTDAGKEEIDIPLSSIFNPDDYYTKNDVDGLLGSAVEALNNKDEELQSQIDLKASEAALTALNDTVASHTSDSSIHFTTGDVQNQIDSSISGKADSTAVTESISVATNDMATQTWVESKNYLTEHQSLSAYSTTEEINISIASATNDMATKTWVGEQGYLTEHQDISYLATKDEVDEKIESAKTEYYTKEEVDALIKAKETEIYNLTKIVGEMGGNVTYTLPNELGTSFNSLMGNNGTVKLTEDTTTGRFGPGITAKNKVTLNLNNNNLTITGLTTSSTQSGIMARGTQEITIGGKGTIDTGGGTCVSTTSTGCTINLTGSTTTYQTDRSGGELIYCYSGTINISNGTFRNNGENKTFTLNCYDANYQNGTAKIIVTGGKFYDFNPADNSAEGEHTNFLAEGYHVETSTVTEDEVEHTIYTVKKNS